MSILEGLNKEQLEAVKTTEGPLLVLSGPGSGKTRVITHRIAYVIEQKLASPEQILAVTFTNKAAGEMKERLRKLTHVVPPWMGTFHSICARFLREDGGALGVSPRFVIYDDSDSTDLVKEILKELDIDPKNFSPNSIRNSISSAKNELIDEIAYQGFARGYFQEVVAKVYLRYQELLKEHGALDFEDLLMKAVVLFDKYPEILEKYQKRFKYILVDEYQDTNKSQYLLTKLLANSHHNICIVGDASQAIYGWRGADYRNILNFEKDFPKTKIINLAQNYRSTQNILSAAKSVISQNRSHPVLDLWTQNPEGVPTVVYQAKNELEEADFIIRSIQNLTSKQGYSLSSFAILYRTNAQSRVLEEALLRDGLPYTIVGGTRFYDRREIRDMIAYLRYLNNPKDALSFKRVINTPPRGIGPKALSEKDNPKVENFRSEMESLRVKNETLKTLDLIDLVLEQTKYLSYLDDGSEESLARIENVKELRSVATEFPALEDFLENVSLVQENYLPNQSKSGEKQEAVTLMTLHSAKGLEFPVVFMIGMEEGLFPHNQSLTDVGQVEEERRLCYVGITRAQEQLYLTYTQARLYFGTRTEGIISRFILEIPENLLIPIRF
ncbi:MAG TPA: UvrD-helicase domain-containing protein [Candidatus Saccharimonadales bacterium]|nr:UvrD-helicase domain-containing protein [Candidatus Saccharimonadales bacterium]